MKTTILLGFVLSANFLSSQDTTAQRKYHFSIGVGGYLGKIMNASVTSNSVNVYIPLTINTHKTTLATGFSFQADRDLRRLNQVFFGQFWHTKGKNEVNFYDSSRNFIRTDEFQPYSMLYLSLGSQYLIPFSKENGLLSRLSAGIDVSFSYKHLLYSSTNMDIYPEADLVRQRNLNLEIYHPIKFYVNSKKSIFIVLRIPFGSIGLIEVNDRSNTRRRIYAPAHFYLLSGNPATIQAGIRI